MQFLPVDDRPTSVRRSIPPHSETNPEKKSSMHNVARARRGSGFTTYCQRNGRSARYDQTIIFVLSHSHGANMTIQARRKRKIAGITNAAAVRTLLSRQSRLIKRNRNLETDHRFRCGDARRNSIFQKISRTRAAVQSGRTPKFPNQNSTKPSSSWSHPGLRWITRAIDPPGKKRPVISATKMVAGMKETPSNFATWRRILRGPITSQ